MKLALTTILILFLFTSIFSLSTFKMGIADAAGTPDAYGNQIKNVAVLQNGTGMWASTASVASSSYTVGQSLLAYPNQSTVISIEILLKQSLFGTPRVNVTIASVANNESATLYASATYSSPPYWDMTFYWNSTPPTYTSVWNMTADTNYTLTMLYQAYYSFAWHDVETWTLLIISQSPTCSYTFIGTFDETTGTLNGDNTTVTVYPTNGSPYNITVGIGNHTITVSLFYSVDYFRILLPNNASRYYAPTSTVETIYVFEPASYYWTYYVSIVDALGVSNAYLESYVYLNGTNFPVERRQFLMNNKVPFVLTQFATYGFRLICDQGTIDFGKSPAGDPSISPAFTFTVSAMNFAVAPITYGSLTLSAVRMNDSWILVQYLDAGNMTVSVNATIVEVILGAWQTVYTDQQTTTASYSLNYLDAEAFKHYTVIVTVVHSSYGTLVWQLPCFATSAQANPFGGLSLLGAFPFDVTQLFGFVIVLFFFACFSAKDHVLGLIVSIVIAAVLSSPPIRWLALSWASISIFLCFSILYALSRRKPA